VQLILKKNCLKKKNTRLVKKFKSSFKGSKSLKIAKMQSFCKKNIFLLKSSISQTQFQTGSKNGQNTLLIKV
jgi:hypothetical protein